MDVMFYAFLVSNLSLLEFRFTEEVMFLVFQGNRIISVVGESLVSLIEDLQAGSKFYSSFILDDDTLPLKLLAKCAVCLRMLITLLKFLQKIYDVDDA